MTVLSADKGSGVEAIVGSGASVGEGSKGSVAVGTSEGVTSKTSGTAGAHDHASVAVISMIKI